MIAFELALVSHVVNIWLGEEERRNSNLGYFLRLKKEYMSKIVNLLGKRNNRKNLSVKNSILSFITICMRFVDIIDDYI